VTRRARRTRWAFLRCGDGRYLDVDALLRGEVRVDLEPGLRSFSILTGEEHALEPEELKAWMRLPSDRAVETDEPLLDELARKGLAVVDENGAVPRDARLREAGWNLYAALYHARQRWSGVDLEIGEGEAAADGLRAATRAHLDRNGPPPPHFHAAPNALETRELPLVEPSGGLYDALARRRTSRVFDSSRRMAETELAVLLRTVFGAQGTAPIGDGAAGVRRTSPSGGGLHPIEAYPLVLDIAGLEPGLHHYHSGDHTLELLGRLGQAEAQELAEAFTCGQGYFRGASLLVVLAARFERSFWKYRGHEKAYAVTLLDAGHLSQTFYLVCADLGLGAFVTAAINNVDIDARLGLDGFAEGSLAICGCGPLLEEDSYLQPRFTPHRPGR
jgi:putative peptide maturation dehydrogenase